MKRRLVVTIDADDDGVHCGECALQAWPRIGDPDDATGWCLAFEVVLFPQDSHLSQRDARCQPCLDAEVRDE